MASADQPSRTRVLVVEDDPTVSEVVARYLENEGFGVETATDGRSAIEMFLESPPDLLVLDIMLPEMDGLEVCRRIRATAPVPIIMLTALGEESDRVMGLDLGADDYITKPFSPRELIARVKSVLRRAHGPLSTSYPELRSPLMAHDLEVDVASHEVRLRGEPIQLTSREFDLLVFFFMHPHQVFTREDLLRHVWGYEIGDTSTVTVHVRRLREKIEKNPADPTVITTVWGTGYRFE